MGSNYKSYKHKYYLAIYVGDNKKMDKYQKSQGNKKIKKGYAGSQMDRYLDWNYLEEVRNIWKGPIVLKGF